MKNFVFLLLILIVSCRQTNTGSYTDLATTANGWQAEVIATIDQSYAGWDVEIGDADNNGLNEILITGCPDSKLAIIKKTNNKWDTHILAEDLAQTQPDPGMGLTVKIVDLNNDGKNELVLSTRGDNVSELITSDHLGYVFMFKVDSHGAVSRELLVDLNEEYAESSWLAVGDVDNDGKNEIVLATGKGDRTKPGISYVVLVEKE